MVLCRGACLYMRWGIVCSILCLAGEEQVANAGTQKWDYCMPRINYADVRRRVGSAFAEKANEIADAVAVVQGLSRETTRLSCTSLDHGFL